MSEHRCHTHPSRCCPDEHPAEVLLRLRENPPKRRMHDVKTDQPTESDASWIARHNAWRNACKREEALLAAKDRPE